MHLTFYVIDFLRFFDFSIKFSKVNNETKFLLRTPIIGGLLLTFLLAAGTLPTFSAVTDENGNQTRADKPDNVANASRNVKFKYNFPF